MTVQLSLFDTAPKLHWPEQELFPLNREDETVEKVLLEDLKDSSSYTIITGFSSLEYLVRFFGERDLPNRKIRILLGEEPEASASASVLGEAPLSRKVWEYWHQRGVSVLLCGKILRLIEEIKQGHLSFYLGPKVHAKIYVGEKHAILGSSNFSAAGLRFQREANVRFPCHDPRYQGVKEIAENYLQLAQEFNQGIIDLLLSLLRPVTWPEALARAIIEILEGGWLDEYQDLLELLKGLDLWPSQRQAVSQAFWVLDQHGSVLIADPTGSGKTKVGIALLAALVYRLLAQQEFSRTKRFIICPPAVKSAWEEEEQRLASGLAQAGIISQGILSFSHTDSYQQAIKNIRQANILLIDEAHNYLTRSSFRSQTLELHNLADHVILMTATPINRGVEDLLRLVELLGLDNFSDEAFETYRKLKRTLEQRGRLQEADFQELARYVQLFTVRRTKRELNRMIEEEPEAYRDRFGRPCKYPREKNLLYSTGETPEDRRLAREIDALGKELQGFIWLRKSLHDWSQGQLQAQGLKVRLAAAKALAAYNIKAMLRSSRAALIEHIYGTEEALSRFKLKGQIKSHTGNVLATLEKMRERPLVSEKGVEDEELPAWAGDPQAFREALDREIEIYREITRLALQISDARERTKVRFLRELLERHPLVIAYDSRLITLHYLDHLCEEEGAPFERLLVTGARLRERQRINRLFALGSSAQKILALCSDAVAEGVNLQAASAVVFLDLPTVIRLAEQRIGRIARLDSPHPEIEIYWPDDSPEFSVRTDKRLVRRHLLVEGLLGANISIPEKFLELAQDFREEVISAREMKDLYETERKRAEESYLDQLQDTFRPIKDLVEGQEALIEAELYRKMKKMAQKNRSLSWVSLVKSRRPFGFFCLRGDRERKEAPRWILFREDLAPETNLGEIASFLRAELPQTEPAPWTSRAEEAIERLLKALGQAKRLLLPQKKRRALELLERLLPKYIRQAKDDPHRLELLYRLKGALAPESNVELSQLADQWLLLLLPRWEKRPFKRNRPLLLKDLLPHLLQEPLSNADLEKLTSRLRPSAPLDHSVCACVIGVLNP